MGPVVAVTVALAFGFSAQAASATTYCVTSPSAPPGCSGTNESSLSAALTAATADTTGSDTIVLPAGTQSSTSGFDYSGSVPLTIEGQGESSTELTASSSGSEVLFDTGAAPSFTVQSLGVVVPSPDSFGIGLLLYGPASVSDVSVTGPGGSGLGGSGIEMTKGGTVSGVSVQDAGTALILEGTTTVEDSTLAGSHGDNGVSVGPGTFTVHRCAISINDGNAVEADDATVYIDDSLLAGTSYASGIAAEGGSTVTGRQLTITGDSTSTGVFSSATAQLTDSIIADPLGNSIFTEFGGTVTTNYSDYDRTTASGTGITAGTNDTPAYVNPDFILGSYRLGPTSPLLSYDPTALSAGESATDLDGLPRITGGGRDLGAYQHQPVSATAVASPSSALTGKGVSFTATGSVDRPNDPLTYAWRFDDGATASGAAVSHAFATAGTHHATVTVTDGLGFSATATASVTVTQPPVISSFSESHKRWRKRKGTTFKFTLNEPASVTLSFAQPKAGRRVRGKCVRKTKHNKHKSSCSLAVGTLKLSGKAGVNTVKFTGKLHGHKLGPGLYTVSIAAAGQTGKPLALKFTILP